jgi:ankyrin repeat protein
VVFSLCICANNSSATLPSELCSVVLLWCTHNYSCLTLPTLYLSYTQSQRQQQLVQLLLSKGADPNTRQANNDTALSLAAFFGHSAVVAELMRAGADARIPDTDGAYPGDTFDAAVTVATQRSVQQLVWGAELFAQRAPALDAAEKARADAAAATAAAAAAAATAAAASRAKQQHSNSPEGSPRWSRLRGNGSPGSPGATAADEKYRRSSVPFVVQVDDKNWSPLHLAALKGDAKRARKLLAGGASTEGLIEHAYTPLLLAAQNGAAGVVRELLEANAVVDARCDRGFTPLLLGAKNGHMEAVQLLLNKGALVEAHNKRGFTALLLAAQNNHGEVVKHLVEARGANMEARTDQGFTPLVSAAATTSVRCY